MGPAVNSDATIAAYDGRGYGWVCWWIGTTIVLADPAATSLVVAIAGILNDYTSSFDARF